MKLGKNLKFNPKCKNKLIFQKMANLKQKILGLRIYV